MADKNDTLSESRRGPVPKYPWERWADGSAWTIYRGEDYDVPTASMARAIYSHAARFDRNVRVQTLRDRDGVEFQFLDDSPVAA